MTETVVDRPGVPEALRDRYWYSAEYEPRQAGQLGTTARIVLPADEQPVAAGGGVVATVSNGPLDALERNSIVRVRDIRTGEAILEAITNLYVEVGAIAGDYLFIAGRDINRGRSGEPEIYPGGGLWAIELAKGAGPIQVVPPEPEFRLGDEERGNGVRGPLKVSPTGATLASAVYLEGGHVGRVDVIDVATLSIRLSVEQFVYTLNDEVAIVKPVDDEIGAVAQLVSLHTGKVQWEARLREDDGGLEPDGEWFLMISALAGENVMLLEFERASELVLLSLDISTGRATELLVQDFAARDARTMYMAPELSDVNAVVLLPVPGVGRAVDLAGGRAEATVLEVASLAIRERLFQIGAP